MWRSGRVEKCIPEEFRFEPRWWHFWFSLVGKLRENCWKVVGKLSENSAVCQCPRNIPSSSSELVGLTWSACRKSVTSPWYLSTASSVRLAEFSVNFFYSATAQNSPRLIFFSCQSLSYRNIEWSETKSDNIISPLFQWLFLSPTAIWMSEFYRKRPPPAYGCFLTITQRFRKTLLISLECNRSVFLDPTPVGTE